MNREPELTVLIADDDPVERDRMTRQFERLGYRVLEAATEREARRILDRDPPAVAVLDLALDTLDAGFTLAYRIKKRAPDTPVIIVTSVTADTGMVFEKSARGEKDWIKADAVLDKPIRFEQLLRELDRCGVRHG